jgi:hypothetical protein
MNKMKKMKKMKKTKKIIIWMMINNKTDIKLIITMMMTIMIINDNKNI